MVSNLPSGMESILPICHSGKLLQFTKVITEDKTWIPDGKDKGSQKNELKNASENQR
jgi:hypothetical protein